MLNRGQFQFRKNTLKNTKKLCEALIHPGGTHLHLQTILEYYTHTLRTFTVEKQSHRRGKIYFLFTYQFSRRDYIVESIFCLRVRSASHGNGLIFC